MSENKEKETDEAIDKSISSESDGFDSSYSDVTCKILFCFLISVFFPVISTFFPLAKLCVQLEMISGVRNKCTSLVSIYVK